MTGLITKVSLFLVPIGLGWTGGYYLKKERKEERLTIGETVIKYTSASQWKFLYLLSLKIFNDIKNNSIFRLLNQKKRSTLVGWLNDKLETKLDIYNTWEDFKKVCVKAIKEEDNDNNDWSIEIPESRFCFMGVGLQENNFKNMSTSRKINLDLASKKGNLFYLTNEENEDYEQYRKLHFSNFNKTNKDLFNEFIKSQYSSKLKDSSHIEEFKVVFEDWLGKGNPEIKNDSKGTICYLKNWKENVCNRTTINN